MKIAILGSAPSLQDAPIEGWETWSLMSNWKQPDLKAPVDKWFEFHSIAHLKKVGVVVDSIKPLQDIDNLWMLEPPEGIKRFPKEQVLKLGDYFTSSIAWLIGLAIQTKPDTIGLFGCDLIQKYEYQKQRPCVEYLLGYARALGINIIIPDRSPLLKGPLYCDDFAHDLKVRNEAAAKELDDAKTSVAYWRGVNDILQDISIEKG